MGLRGFRGGGYSDVRGFYRVVWGVRGQIKVCWEDVPVAVLV